MTKSRALLLTFLSSLMFCGPVMASTPYYVEAATIESVTVIQVPLSGHLVGNLELKIAGGFTLPAGASCVDRTYITTLKSVDADKRMFALLLTAQTTKQHVTLIVTDDPAYTAFNGRCSLAAVILTP